MEGIGRVWRWLGEQNRSILALGAIVSILGVILANCRSCDPPPPPPPEVKKVCASFDEYRDNQKIGSNININDFIFQSRNRKGRLFVNRSGGLMMLQFMNEGLIIYLPDSSELVDIQLAEFYTPVKLEVLDDHDVVLNTRTIDRDNSTESLRFKGNGFSIDRVRLSGGGNEGGLIEICARVVQNP